MAVAASALPAPPSRSGCRAGGGRDEVRHNALVNEREREDFPDVIGHWFSLAEPLDLPTRAVWLVGGRMGSLATLVLPFGWRLSYPYVG